APAAGGRAGGPSGGQKSALVTHEPGPTQADVEMGWLLRPADARRPAVYDVVADLTSAALTDTLREDTGATYGVHASQATARGGTAALRVSPTIHTRPLPIPLAALRRSSSHTPPPPPS